ncbi:hypothetical protein ACQ4PT_054084 [Festuca glaucescens]
MPGPSGREQPPPHIRVSLFQQQQPPSTYEVAAPRSERRRLRDEGQVEEEEDEEAQEEAPKDEAEIQHLFYVIGELASFSGNANYWLAAYGLRVLSLRLAAVGPAAGAVKVRDCDCPTPSFDGGMARSHGCPTPYDFSPHLFRYAKSINLDLEISRAVRLAKTQRMACALRTRRSPCASSVVIISCDFFGELYGFLLYSA